MVSKVLAFGSDNIMLPSIKGNRRKTLEEIANNIIIDNIKSFKENHDYLAFLIEKWYTSKRIDRI